MVSSSAKNPPKAWTRSSRSARATANRDGSGIVSAALPALALRISLALELHCCRIEIGECWLRHPLHHGAALAPSHRVKSFAPVLEIAFVLRIG
jgi:hypothetical protein